jgi:Putative beta-lactamase-inhibitor-like, PepSY-like
MRNLKWMAMLMLALSTLLWNCQPQDSDITPEEEAAVLEDFLFLTTTEQTTSTSTPSPFTSGRGPQFFSRNSADTVRKCRMTELAIADLPTSVTNYISANYAGSTIERAGKNDEGKIMVLLKKADGTKVGLAFDANGAFISERQHKGKGTQIAVSELPAAVTSYVTASYAGSTIERAMKDTDGNFRLIVKKSDGTKVGLGFDKNGKFVGELATKGKKGGPHGSKGR